MAEKLCLRRNGFEQAALRALKLKLKLKLELKLKLKLKLKLET